MPRLCDVEHKFLMSCYWEFKYPCGIKWCSYELEYWCGIKWCKKWGIPYPCGNKWCKVSIPYPCGFKWCNGKVWYPCIKTRKIPGWCYDCSHTRIKCSFLWCCEYCCEDGKEYRISCGPSWKVSYEDYGPAKTVKAVSPYNLVGDCKKIIDPQDNRPIEPPGGYYEPGEGGTVSGPSTGNPSTKTAPPCFLDGTDL